MLILTCCFPIMFYSILFCFAVFSSGHTINITITQDIWSLGITLCEMATAKKPYRNAAAAIFSVCVSKQYPVLPEAMSSDAVAFLGR